MHLVPRREISLDQMSKLAAGLGWTLDRRAAEAAEREGLAEYRWRITPRGEVKLVKSEALSHDYFVVATPDGSVAQALTSTFPCYETAEILEMLGAATTADEREEALLLLAATALHDYRVEVHGQLEQSLDDDDSLVRMAALMACYHLGWKQLRALVEHVREADESENVRALAWNLLGSTRWSRG